MTVAQVMLYPFSLFYGVVMGLRNQLYDQRYFKASNFSIPVINIGNLTVGGTGKTPHVEYVLSLLRNKKVATLSRGYKRATKGFVLADQNASAATLGDEPFQYYQDFPGVRVAVSENRAVGIKRLLEHQPDLEVIVLDDAFQHRSIVPSLNILLTDYYRLFYKDLVLPAGRLREFPIGAGRADIIVVTKCPGKVGASQQATIKQAINKAANKKLPVFFTKYEYGNPISCGPNKPVTTKILLVTAIANPQPLEKYLNEQGFTILHQYQFADHYSYTANDVKKIYSDWQRYARNQEVVIFTTRKDATKLWQPEFISIWQQAPLFIIPVKVTFLENQAGFDSLILNHVADRSKPEIN